MELDRLLKDIPRRGAHTRNAAGIEGGEREKYRSGVERTGCFRCSPYGWSFPRPKSKSFCKQVLLLLELRIAMQSSG